MEPEEKEQVPSAAMEPDEKEQVPSAAMEPDEKEKVPSAAMEPAAMDNKDKTKELSFYQRLLPPKNKIAQLLLSKKYNLNGIHWFEGVVVSAYTIFLAMFGYKETDQSIDIKAITEFKDLFDLNLCDVYIKSKTIYTKDVWLSSTAEVIEKFSDKLGIEVCLLYTSPSPRD